jgi:periplasmic protein TonB
MPNNKQQLPEINYAALASSPVKKRRGLAAFILLILLLGGAGFFFRDRLSWFAHVLTSEPATVPQNASVVENPPKLVPQPKLKPKKLVEAEQPPTASSGTNERVTRPNITIEVISPGGQRRTIHPSNATVNLDLGGSTAATSAQTQPAPAAPNAVNAAAHEQVLADSPEVLYRPSEPVYPRLAEQMKVEGSVTLHVNIDKNGNIVDTQVLSGPEVLATAAREAIGHWRFRPHYKNGAPVETEAHVVVNFTISTR